MASILVLLALFVSVSLLSAVVHAQNSGSSCGSDPLSAAFGCNSIITSGRGIDIASIVTLFFRFVIGAAVLWTVWHLALAGFKISGAKESPEERQKGIEAGKNALIGFVVALLSFGVTNLVAGIVGGGSGTSAIGTPCTARDDQTQLVFTGTIEQDGSNLYCVLKDAEGRQIRRGPVQRL